MPYTDNSLNLEVVYEAHEASYSYATVTLADAIPVASQLRPRWELAQVELAGQLTQTFVNTVDLSATVRDQIFNIDAAYYSVQLGASTITLDPSLAGATISTTDSDGSTADYIYPALTTVSPASPFKIRRSTDITDGVVDFQSGGRLTAAQLNSALQQIVFASQELLEFGSEAGAAEVDLNGLSVNQLGDVNINTANHGAIVTIGTDGVLTDSTTGGTNAVLSVNGDTGQVVLDFVDVGAAPTVHTHTKADITDLATLVVSDLDDVDAAAPAVGDTLIWDGSNWVPAERITVASGTGSPPSAWLTDPKRVDGDIYIRTG